MSKPGANRIRGIGTANLDRLYHVTVDDTYIYGIGVSRIGAENQNFMLQLKRSDLTGVTDNYEDTGSFDEGRAILLDGTTIWCVVWQVTNLDSYVLRLLKLNASDLTLSAARTYAASAGANYFAPGNATGIQDSSFIYVVGNDATSGTFHGGMVKISKTDYTATANLLSQANTYLRGVCQDRDFVYAVGYQSGGTPPAVIVKYNKSDLTLSAMAGYGTNNNDTVFNAVAEWGDYLYAVGSTTGEGAGGSDALIIRYNKSDLTINARKILGGSGNDPFNAIWIDNNGIVYAVGGTGTEMLITRWTADLSSVTQIKLGDAGAGVDIAHGVTGDDYGLIVVGYSAVSAYGGDDAAVVELSKDLSTTGTTTPAGFTVAAAGLTLATSGLNTSSPGWTLTNFTMTASTVTPTISDAGMTVSSEYSLDAPWVTTERCTAITGSTATGNGTIVDIGSGSVTQHGHCWATTKNPTTSDSKTTNGAGVAGRFTSAITGLMAGNKYYVRAYATNATGTSYGANVSLIAGIPGTQLQPGILEVVGNRLHYVGADGLERWLEGTEV